MAQKQVATYAIKVDLNCEKCRKKIKKVLCEIPQIQDQLYDEKNNVVVVKVVCCSPDKVKKKICCKGGKTVKGIELLKPPPPPKPKEKEKGPPPPPPKPKEDPPPPPPPQEKPKDPPPPPPPEEKPKDPPPPPPPEEKPKPPPVVVVPDKPPNPTPPPPPPKDPAPAPAPAPPPPVMVPMPMEAGGRTCCRECYEGREGGPCWTMYGRPCFSNESSYVYGRPVYDSWGGGSYVGYRQDTRYYAGGSRCTDYISDDNPAGCFIM